MWNFNSHKDKIALISDDNNKLTYGELQLETEKLAKAVNGRMLVFCLCTNTIGSVIGYTSLINNNVVPVLLNAMLDKDLLNNLIITYKPKYIWSPNDENYNFVYEAYNYKLYKTNFDSEYKLNDNLALLLTTSGSTGSPKFVRQTYKNIKVNSEQIVEYLKLDDTERPITTLPMNYTYGLSIINSHLLVGATILLTDKTLMNRDFWNFFKSENTTSFGGVPYTYEILDKLRFSRMDLPSLRYFTQAGGKLSPELHKKFAEYANEKNKEFIVMYGACEATARMGYLPAEKSLEKYGSCGIPIPRGKFTLFDENNNIITESEKTGKLVYEGENVCMGYAECGEDLIKGDERNGVLHTGDMAKRDSDGYYYIVGRMKRFLKMYGNRVNLDEIDRLIKSEFNYIDCATTGVDDHMYIFVIDEKIVDNVHKFIASKTNLNPKGFEVIKIDSIPKNDSGKILYNELRKYIKN